MERRTVIISYEWVRVATACKSEKKYCQDVGDVAREFQAALLGDFKGAGIRGCRNWSGEVLTVDLLMKRK